MKKSIEHPMILIIFTEVAQEAISALTANDIQLQLDSVNPAGTEVYVSGGDYKQAKRIVDGILEKHMKEIEEHNFPNPEL